MNDFVKEQIGSTLHKLAVILFPLAVFSAYFGPYVFAGAMLVFFLVTSFGMLKKMLFYMLLLGLVSLIPGLNIVVWVVMVIFFLMRIGFVVKHWRPFASGVAIYGGSALIATRGSYIAELRRFAEELGNPVPDTYWFEAVLVSVSAALALHLTLRWLYAHRYGSAAALGIMGSVPLIIISFILPFLKLHIGGDAVAHYHGTGEHLGHAGEPLGGHHGGAEVQDPQHLHVKSHLRTPPDGDPTNNLSYRGPDAKPVNPDTLVHVGEHMRTAPDGIAENNFSYAGSESTAFSGIAPPLHAPDRTAIDDDLMDELLRGGYGSGIAVEGEKDEYFYGKDGVLLSASALAPAVRQKMTEVDKHRAVGQNAVDRIINQHGRNDGLQS
ncbi:hypothetical protein [Saccharibacillus alkalitolerans]|uniref:Uncharacterized protein n=1 Tax=Saccharibacillus alkalitolerans TaxID=2705290 RepID=A0ABX0F1X6_9BACL|nr:hypothetical protein [Saccharibacillus alkalitolerans]NGZ74976.1 hypothetical protein [Saccharibacillus alkalitolerans]